MITYNTIRQNQRCAVSFESKHSLYGRCQGRKGYSGKSRRADCGRLQNTDNDPDASWNIRDGRIPDVQYQKEEPIGKTVAASESYRTTGRVWKRT